MEEQELLEMAEGFEETIYTSKVFRVGMLVIVAEKPKEEREKPTIGIVPDIHELPKHPGKQWKRPN